MFCKVDKFWVLVIFVIKVFKDSVKFIEENIVYVCDIYGVIDVGGSSLVISFFNSLYL